MGFGPFKWLSYECEPEEKIAIHREGLINALCASVLATAVAAVLVIVVIKRNINAR
jgi:hypothetical protein